VRSGDLGSQRASALVNVSAIPGVQKDYLSVLDLSRAAIERLLRLASRLKRERSLRRHAPTAEALAGHHVALLFEKPSLRTKVTFEIAVRELGGEVIAPDSAVIFGRREASDDIARNLERWVSGVAIRTFAQEKIERFAAAAPRVHVINALTDAEHPCQALADYLTLEERLGGVNGKTLAFVGDGNNVATSLAYAGALLGTTVRVASPPGYELGASVLERCRAVGQQAAAVRLVQDPWEAVAGADAVYTDVWTSMGQEQQAGARARAFGTYQVTPQLMAAAKPGALFMHCLPAHRGEEVTDAVMDSEASVVFDQAENRLHSLKALLLMLMAPEHAAG
jgi:ornithine carbamoyltransferase